MKPTPKPRPKSKSERLASYAEGGVDQNVQGAGRRAGQTCHHLGKAQTTAPGAKSAKGGSRLRVRRFQNRLPQAALLQRAVKEESMSNYLTQDDVDNYGPELIDVTQRAALQAVTPHLPSTAAAAGG